VLAGIFARYSLGAELRPQIWIDSLTAARTYFPVGAGLGAFLPVFLAAERLEAIHPVIPNRAHNDFLELVIEAGALGFAVAALMIALLARQALIQWREGSARSRRQMVFALAVLAIVGLHSLVDYPLRSLSLACVAAAGAGLLIPVSRARRGADVPVSLRESLHEA
jgi:O-antigen ligase